MEGHAAETGLRVLIVGELERGERGCADALALRGFRVASVRDPADALRTLRRDGADVVVLALPLAGADPVAACAALKEGPEPPLVVVADASEQAAALGAALPEERRPDACLARPLDAAKMALAIHECARAGGERAEATAHGLSLAEVLMDRKAARASEVLEVRSAGVCTAIHLHAGDPIFAEGGSLQETLGRQLVRRGAIGQEDYARVVARMTERVIQHQSLRLGEVLVELGLLSPAEVYDALALQVREKIVACFQWERFEYDLHEVLDEPGELGIYQCPPMEALVLAGVRAHYGPERVEAVLGRHARAALVLNAPPEELVPLFQPTAAEQRLLRAVDGTHTADDLARSGLLGPLPAGQLLAALALGGALGYRALPAAARPAAPRAAPSREAAPTRLRLSPVAPSARPAAAAAGAQAPARTAAPAHSQAPAATAAHAPAPAAVAGNASASSARRAFDPLVQLRRKMGVGPGAGVRDAKQARLEAEHAFNQGLRLQRESLLPGSLREFRRAVELLPDEPEYRLLESWLEYRLAQGADAHALAAAKVRACAERVLRASRTSARAHAVLGQLALQEGDDEAAERSLRLAVRYDASDVEIERALRLLEMRRRPKS